MAETTALGAAIITGNVLPTCAPSSAPHPVCPPRILPRHPPSDRCAALCRLSQCGGRDGAEAAAATGYRRPRLLELLLVFELRLWRAEFLAPAVVARSACVRLSAQISVYVRESVRDPILGGPSAQCGCSFAWQQ